MRIGNGYDIHKLAEGRPLILGGVSIPFNKGLHGHSDGDALAHAIIDALLGAAKLGDIGQHFPPGDARYKDADSMQLLRRTAKLVREQGMAIINIDSTIICEAPKLGPHIASMVAALGSALNLDENFISVKAKTNEGLGYLGAGEAIAVLAVALIE